MPRLRPRVVQFDRDLPSALRVARSAPADANADAAAGGGTDGNVAQSALARLITYIPGEVIAVHQAITGLMTAEPAMVDRVMPWVGLALLAFTPVWVWFSTSDKGEAPATHQIVLATFAFAVWLLALPNPAVYLLFAGWKPLYGSIVLIVTGTLLLPLFDRMILRWRRRMPNT